LSTLEKIQEKNVATAIFAGIPHEPVARLVAPGEEQSVPPGQTLNIRAVEGHKVLIPTFTHAELAEELFGQR
jgi:hypothetical protein